MAHDKDIMTESLGDNTRDVSTSMDDFDVLVMRYLDGLSGPDENRLLNKELARNTERRECFITLAQQHGRLGELMKARVKQGRRVSFPLAVGISVAAALAILAGTTQLFHWGEKESSTAVARISELQGQGARWQSNHEESAGTWRAAASGEALQPGGEMVTGADSLVQLTLKDGSVIDLDRNTHIVLPGETASHDLFLREGSLYCSISKRETGSKPFVIRMESGHLVAVMGTTFGLNAHRRKTTLVVEEGKVRIEAPGLGTSREVAALQKVEVDDKGISESVRVMLYEIAPWKFGQNESKIGTVLFQDEFEEGMKQWRVISGDCHIRMDHHKQHNLQLGRHKNRRPCIFAANYVPRHENFEVRAVIHGRPVRPVDLVFVEPDDPSAVMFPEWTDVRVHTEDASPKNYVHKFRVHGMQVQHRVFWQKNLVSEREGRIGGPYAGIGVARGYGEGWKDKPSIVCLDNFVVRTIGKDAESDDADTNGQQMNK